LQLHRTVLILVSSVTCRGGGTYVPFFQWRWHQQC